MKSGPDVEKGEGLPVDQSISSATPRHRLLAFATASTDKCVDPETSFRLLGSSGCSHDIGFGQRPVWFG